MRFGHHFYNWDWELLAKLDQNFDSFLKLTKETGWEGFEMKPNGLENIPEIVKEKCAQAGIACAAIGGFAGIKTVIDYAHAAGAGIARCIPPKEESQRWVDYAAERGVIIAIHNHIGPKGQGSGAVETREELLKYLDRMPGVYGCPDTGHLMLCGSDPVQTIRDIGERCGYIHLKDIDSQLAAQGKRGQSFVELGTGALDLAGTMKALEDIGYNGWVMVERDGRVDDYVQSARNMRRVLRKLGY